MSIPQRFYVRAKASREAQATANAIYTSLASEIKAASSANLQGLPGQAQLAALVAAALSDGEAAFSPRRFFRECGLDPDKVLPIYASLRPKPISAS